MKTKDIITRNMFRQLSNEEFGTNQPLEPMSQWKMKHIAVVRDLLFQDFNYSSATTYEFSVNYLEKRRAIIFNNERHAIDTSVETLRFLNLLIYNTEHIIANGISVPGIVAIGKYLRTRGQNIDFVKLDTWITQLRIKRLSSLIASVLIQGFEFEPSELPFLYKVFPDAFQQLCNRTTALQSNKRIGHTRMQMNYSPLTFGILCFQKVITRLSNIEE